MRRFGIDVSKWQNGISFTTAKLQGVEFAIIRGAYGNKKDSSFDTLYRQAKSANLGVGCYWWTRAVNEAQAREEAEALIKNCLAGKQFEYPIYIDVEDELLSGLDKAKVDAIITAACETLEKAGYYAGFYLNENWYKNKCNGSELAKRFTVWVAKWCKDEQTAYPMWQFGGETNKIRTNKIAGYTCDQDYCYVDFPSIIKKAGLNGFSKSGGTSEVVKKSVTEIANEVLAGTWGNGTDRKSRLEAAGYNYNEVQAKVNEILGINKQESYKTYVVKNGDNLTKIAKKYGTTVNKIAKDNNISNPNKIYAGQKLIIK